MSLPGLQLNALPIEEKALVVHELSPSTEWRFEVAFGDTIDVKVIPLFIELDDAEFVLTAHIRYSRALWNRACPAPNLYIPWLQVSYLYLAWMSTRDYGQMSE